MSIGDILELRRRILEKMLINHALKLKDCEKTPTQEHAVDVLDVKFSIKDQSTLILKL